MHQKVISNAVFKHKGFVYRSEVFDRDASRISVTVEPRRGSRPVCSCCGQPGSTYDRMRERSFQMVPIWGIAVVLLYRMRRVDCQHCGKVVVEQVPWSVGGKSRLTTALAHHLAGWARFLSWKEVANRCGVGWEAVAQSVAWLVDYGLKHRVLDGIHAIGVDE